LLDQPAVVRVRQELEGERRRAAGLANELAALRASEQARASTPQDGASDELRRELRDAKQRLESLRKEIEARDTAASEGIQARLAQDALLEVQRAKEALEREVNELRAATPAAALEAAKRALASRVAELEADDAELRERVRRLEGELASAKAPAEAGGNLSTLFFKLQAENRELRQKLEQRASGGVESPALFFQLQARNLELEKKVAELSSRASAAPAGAAPSPAAPGGSGSAEGAGSERTRALEKENHELRLSKADMLAELEALRTKLASALRGGASVRPTGAAAPAPSPAPKASAGGGAAQALQVLRELAEEDLEGAQPRLADELLPFVVLELLRFLRQVERVVTRMASDFIQLYDQQTILPDVSGNLRNVLAALLEDSGDEARRQKLVSYLEEMRRWLVVALGANRRAAERFAEELRSELSERALTANRPISALKKMTGGADAELWTRVCEHMKKLTSDAVEERLQSLARACAEEIRREQGRS
ncbi:MAG: hypothetical protein JNM84_00970, partial [Planctomycetes bacterium]|nr:hypothetical protein [Planctomycetota bacterium]